MNENHAESANVSSDELSGSLERLAPEWHEGEPEPDPDELYELFCAWCASGGFELWPHQEEALLSLYMGNHVILATPTGSGKSLVALGLHFLALSLGWKSYYTAPIKALVSEKFFSLCEVFGKDNVGMITGDISINPDAIIVCCTQEILAGVALREGDGADIGYVVMDEFHYFADRERGWAWQVPLLTLTKSHFLLMSATLGDTSAIAQKIEEMTGVDVDCIADAPRPVPLSYRYVISPLEATVEVLVRENKAPIYVVQFSQDSALESAQSLASFGIADKACRDQLKTAIKGVRFTTAFGKILQRLLLCGVGVHHAGMLPRYRLLIEKLAQRGLLPVICGTDTLGVGINVPIHTVLLCALSKYDGQRARRLTSREFHQIAGRAGRAGFDEEGLVVAQATEYEIERQRALTKAGGDPKKARSIKTKQPPPGFVGWKEEHFNALRDSVCAALVPRLRITNAIVLAEVVRGSDARARCDALIDDSMQSAEEKQKLHARTSELFTTLIDTGVIEVKVEADGSQSYSTTVEVPDNFALDQPLSPFLIAALELLDPESESYEYDLISMAEATLENPRAILKAQEREARTRAMAEMKADGVEYEERCERIREITYPMPLAELLDEAFSQYCLSVPWAADYTLQPKSILRDMLERFADFKAYVQTYRLARAEGALLRYLSDAWRCLDKTLPLDKRTERLEDIISWLGLLIRSIDSSLIDEWMQAGTERQVGAFEEKAELIPDRRGFTILVRNALFQRVKLAAKHDIEALAELDSNWGYRELKWQHVLDEFYFAHTELRCDADARNTSYFRIDTSDEDTLHFWHVHQIFLDSDDDCDFGIMADVDIDATLHEGSVVFNRYRAGSIEELLAQ